MPSFVYEALDRGGRQIRGVIEANDEQVILEKLRNLGYYPVGVKLQHSRVSDFDLMALPGLRGFFHRVKPRHLTSFTRQLATLIDAGLPILRSLSILQEQVESVVFKEKIRSMARDIEGGSTLSEAMAKHPTVFDKLYVNMVRAGEIGGAMEAVLHKVAEYLEKRAAMMGKIKSAMTYPVVVLGLAVTIVSLIVLFIVPKFADIYAQLGASLPMPTQMLVYLGYGLANYSPIVLLGCFVACWLYRRVEGTREGKYLLDQLKLRIPVLGVLIQKTAIVRFSGTLATLITSGVPILQALDICRETSGNEVLTRAADAVFVSVREGDSIHEPLSRHAIFPPLVVHMVAVGEETGAIDQMLVKVAEAYEREVDDMINALTSILEPIMIVGLGLLIGAVVVALYLPLFNLVTIVGKG